MPDASRPPLAGRRSRGWLLYAIAWLPLVALYAMVIGGANRLAPLHATVIGLLHVLPAAVGGVGAVFAARRWPLEPRRPSRFLLHAGLGLVYGAVWTGWDIMGMAQGGDLAAAWARARNWAGWQLFTGVCVYAVVAGLASAFALAARLREAEVRRVSAELAALRAQLNPHFLFNTLHSVAALVPQDPARAEAALERLAELLRYVLAAPATPEDDVTLARELAFVQDYLALEALRLGERLKLDRAVDDSVLDARLPALTLQPLVENAVRHAVAPRAAGGTIRLCVARTDAGVEVSVRDDGDGRSVPSTGVGLSAVRQRLERRFGAAARLDAAPAPEGGFVARVVFPFPAAA